MARILESIEKICFVATCTQNTFEWEKIDRQKTKYENKNKKQSK